MKGISEFIKEHNAYLQTQASGTPGTSAPLDQQALAFHLIQIRFLQHERLVHLMVMLFIALAALICLGIYLFSNILLFLPAFGLLLVLTLFYILHYYKLENTVIQWYWVYVEHMKRNSHRLT